MNYVVYYYYSIVTLVSEVFWKHVLGVRFRRLARSKSIYFESGHEALQKQGLQQNNIILSFKFCYLYY